MPNPGRVRTSAGAPLPSASRALRSFASLARSYSPRACAHRPTRLAAGWSSTTSPLPPTPSTTACALPPSLTSALAGRALAAALAALHRVLVDAAATADLIARAAAAAALAAAAPDVAALPLCHHPRPAAFNAAALAAALAAASAAAIAAAPSTSTFSPSHCQRLHRHPHRQLPGRGRRRRPFLRMAMVLLEPVPVCGRAVLFLHVLFCGVCFVHRL